VNDDPVTGESADPVARPRGPSDRNLVLACRPGARVESRKNPRSGRAEFRVSYEPVPGRSRRPLMWEPSEVRAWRGACVRLGLRIRHS
jgi:hypothetical protein